jgi:hypothetical protein|tara:strand:- start:3983 stop:4381 length:399 start_codon:yes stop_codon:yes gene_type:complete
MAQLDVSKSTESQAARREAEEAVRAAERRLREITEEISELIKLGEEIEKEKAQLSKERDRLVIEKVEILKAKADVEKREELFSMGFYTTFLTSVIAFAGLAIRIPNSRLERRLKVLEIEAKEYELEQLRTQD